jgi:hypothetical protein
VARVAPRITQSKAPEAGCISTKVGTDKQLAKSNGIGTGVLAPAAQKAVAQFSETDSRAPRGFKLDDVCGRTGPIAKMQKLVRAKVPAKLAGAGVVVPQSNNLVDLANSVYSAQLPWTNGAAQPVNELLKVHKDQLDIYLTIKVQQAAQ